MLQNRLNFLIDGNVGLLKSVDLKGGAGNLAEVKVAADVVILVERAKNALHFFALETKLRERRKKCKAASENQIFFDNFAQCHKFMAGCKVSTRQSLHYGDGAYSPHPISNPHVRAGVSIGRVDVKQVCLGHLPQGLAQFGGSVLCTEERAGRGFDAFGLIEAGNLPA